MGQRARDVCAGPACPAARMCHAHGYTRQRRMRGGRNWGGIGKRRAGPWPGLAGCCCCLCSPLQSRKAGRRPRLAPVVRRAPAGPCPRGRSVALRPQHRQFDAATRPGSVLAGPSPAPHPGPLRQAGAKSCPSPWKGFTAGTERPLTARSRLCVADEPPHPGEAG